MGKKKSFVRNFITIFWLTAIGFVLYRSVLIVPQDHTKLYLIYSKFNGYQNQTLFADQYYISWQNLLPGNIKLLPIPNTPQKINLRKQAQLPGADTYSYLIPQSTQPKQSSPFSYEIELNYSYRIKTEEILTFTRNPSNSIYEKNKLNLDPVSAWRLSFSEKTKNSLEQELESMFDQTLEALPDIFTIENRLSSTLAESFPELEVVNIDVQKYNLPDLELYQTVKQNYQALLQEVSGQALTGLLNEQNQRLDQEIYLQNIRQLGEILNKYPILIQYFAVTGSPQLRNNILENILPKNSETSEDLESLE